MSGSTSIISDVEASGVTLASLLHAEQDSRHPRGCAAQRQGTPSPTRDMVMEQELGRLSLGGEGASPKLIKEHLQQTYFNKKGKKCFQHPDKRTAN